MEPVHPSSRPTWNPLYPERNPSTRVLGLPETPCIQNGTLPPCSMPTWNPLIVSRMEPFHLSSRPTWKPLYPEWNLPGTPCVQNGTYLEPLVSRMEPTWNSLCPEWNLPGTPCVQNGTYLEALVLDEFLQSPSDIEEFVLVIITNITFKGTVSINMCEIDPSHVKANTFTCSLVINWIQKAPLFELWCFLHYSLMV